MRTGWAEGARARTGQCGEFDRSRIKSGSRFVCAKQPISLTFWGVGILFLMIGHRNLKASLTRASPSVILGTWDRQEFIATTREVTSRTVSIGMLWIFRDTLEMSVHLFGVRWVFPWNLTISYFWESGISRRSIYKSRLNMNSGAYRGVFDGGIQVQAIRVLEDLDRVWI